jgi:hypothetical protein
MQIVVAQRVLGRGREFGRDPTPYEEMEDALAERPAGAGQRRPAPGRTIEHQIRHACPPCTEILEEASPYSDRAGAAAASPPLAADARPAGSSV